MVKISGDTDDQSQVGAHKIIAPSRHLRADDLVKILKENELSARDDNPIQNQNFEDNKIGIWWM